MSSKVKSEKTKVKFAQSNINHVYKGNTAETHHKPVRQYGMQVVGKLQGTRRLPPPAWVPSLKAETGGLDSRVSLVPAGGGGWGAPSSTASSEPTCALSSEMDRVPVSSGHTTVNGTLFSESIGNSLEPAYAIANFCPQGTVTTDSSAKKEVNDVMNGSIRTSVSESSVVSHTSEQPSTQLLKSQSDKPNVVGGLAANKPFFQRPIPIVTTSSSVTTVLNRPEDSNQPTKSSVSAREIIGETGGWSAVDQDEPDFDEHIVFSDDEESVEEIKPSAKSSVSNLQEANEEPPVSSVSVTSSSLPSTSVFMKPFVSSVGDSSEVRTTSTYSIIPPSVYVDSSNLGRSDSWTTNDLPFTLNCLAGQPLPRHVQNIPFSLPSHTNPGCVTSEASHVLPNVQFMQHAVSTHGIPGSLYPHANQTRLVTSAANNLMDSSRHTDVDADMQQAQRQVRTQEYKTAIERAQQARLSRQKYTDSGPVDTDTFLPNHHLTLKPDSYDSRSITSVCTSLNTASAQAGSNFLPPTSAHLSVNPLMSNVVPPQVLLPSTYQQATNHPSDLAAAVAAATAAAMAYTGGPGGNNPGRTGVDLPNNIAPLPPRAHTPTTITPKPGSTVPWHTPFVSGTSTSTAVAALFTQQPHVYQLLQNALALSTNGSQVSKTALPSQGVFLNPDCFVENFLELLNQQQLPQQTSWSHGQNQSSIASKNVSSTAVQASSLTDKVLTSATDSAAKSSISGANMSLGNTEVCAIKSSLEEFDDVHEDSQNLRPSSKLPQGQTTIATSLTSTCEDSGSTQRTRVPGLMDVKVSCASSQLAHLWDKEDYLREASSRSFRGRGKHATSYRSVRGSTKDRGAGRSQAGYSISSDFKSLALNDTSSMQSYSNSGDHAQKRDHKSHSSWSNSKSHSIDNPLTDSDNSHSKPKLGTSGEDQVGGHQLVSNAQTEPTWIPSDDELNNPSGDTSSESDEDGDELSEILEGDVGEEDEKPDKSENTCGKDSTKFSSNKVRKSHLSSHVSHSKVYRGDYTRRGRRARPSASHFTSSRNYSDDFSSYSGRYTKGSEYEYYSRHQYPSSSSTRGYKSSHNSSSFHEQTKPRATDDAYHRSEKANRNTNVRNFSGSSSNYYNGRSARGYSQYDYEGTSRDQTVQYTDHHYNSSTSDTRRQNRNQKYSSTKSQFSSTSDYYNDYIYSDGEGSRQYYRKNHDSDNNLASTRNRSYEANGRFHKTYRKNFVSSKSNDFSEFGDKSVSELHENTVAHSTSKKSMENAPLLTEELDDGDIPTIRVPAADPVTQPTRHHYTHSRSGRMGAQKVAGVSRRISGRTNQAHQQLKRSDAPITNSSRRYREMRDRYNDEKDGDGGAAAGGAGRSTTGTGAFNSITFKGNSSGGGENSHNSGNHCGGGQTDSVAGCVEDQGQPSRCDSRCKDSTFEDTSEGVAVQRDQSVSNFRSNTVRRRQASATTGNLSDANDNDEWETASEGSPGARSTVNSVSLRSSLSASKHLTQLATSQNNNSNVFVLEKKKLQSVHGDGNVFSNTKTSPVLGTDCSIVEPSSDVPKRLTRSSGKVTSCHVAAERTFHRRDHDGDSGGGIGTAFSGNTTVFPGSENSRVSHTFSNDGNTNEKSHISGSGDRWDGNLKKSSSLKSTRSHTTYPKPVDTSTIPPLMSIKPQGPFAQNHYTFGTFPQWRPRSEQKDESETNDHFGEGSQDVNNTSVFHGDSADLYADGFTKVVSKTTKNFARRRLQQELSVTSSSTSRKTNEYSKASGFSRNLHTQEESQPHSESSVNRKDTSNSKSVTTYTPKVTPKKPKALPAKLTFMGPPLCLDSTTSTTTVTSSVTSTLADQNKSQVVYISSISNATTTVMQSVSFSSAPTWSKVVGTRSVKGSSYSSHESPVSNKAMTTVLSNANPIWQSDANEQSCTVAQQGSKMKTKDDNVLLHNTISSEVTNTNCSVVYTSMQSLWSSNNPVTVSVVKNESCASKLLIPNCATSPGALPTHVGNASPSTNSTSNNICKVKPQQQQCLQSSASNANILTTNTALSPSNNMTETSNQDLAPENERPEYDCTGDVSRSHKVLRQLASEGMHNSVPFTGRAPPSTWSTSAALYPSLTTQQLPNVPLNGHENSFSANGWSIIDQNLDATTGCLTGNFNINTNQSHYQQLGSNVLSNILTSNSAIPPIDNLNKQSGMTVSARQPQPVQPYQSPVLPSPDQINLYSNGPYANAVPELGKISSTNMCMGSQPVTFGSVAGSMYMHPQSSTIQSQRSFHHTLPVPPSHVQSQMSQPQKCRQRVTHPVDPTNYTGYSTFAGDIQNDYTFPPSIGGCMQPTPTGGLYSAVHAQSQANYPQNPGRQTLGPSNGNPWSLLGNPTAASNLQLSTIPPAAANGGGLLPHPIPQGGYGNAACHFHPAVSSNPTSTFTNHSNYVGVIGGGRPNTDHSNPPSRQRSLQHHSLYPHPNLPQSPSAQGQQSFQLASPFYPSLSPSHQRVPLQQFGNSQGRGSLPGHINPQTGLYAAAFGAPSHPSNQPTPPPIGFFSNPFPYPSRPDGLH